ncbi:MAG: hypothetical protein CUN56_02680 [Phototrophicales bacterium]|nr:MAG: hypothetical protein CUN56_02680 [Phototrophicales bacterium]
MQYAVIFDFGGVLMKTIDYTPRFDWDDRLGLPRGSVEKIVHNQDSWVKAQTGLISPQAYWADVARQLKLTDLGTLPHDFYSGDALDQGLIHLIHDLRRAGRAVALLSNDTLELMDKLRRLQIDDLFDPLVISAQIGVMKPHPAAYQTVLNQLQCPPQEAIFIDDRLENVQGAAALGIHAVHYTPGLDLAKILNA